MVMRKLIPPAALKRGRKRSGVTSAAQTSACYACMWWVVCTRATCDHTCRDATRTCDAKDARAAALLLRRMLARERECSVAQRLGCDPCHTLVSGRQQTSVLYAVGGEEVRRQ